jgi:hypothetical protein
MEKLGKTEEFKARTIEPKKWSASIKPRKVNVREEKKQK